MLTRCIPKTGPFVMSSHLYLDKDELHENHHQYTGGVTRNQVNVYFSLTILCQ